MDPLVAAASVVMALQTVVARNMDAAAGGGGDGRCIAGRGGGQRQYPTGDPAPEPACIECPGALEQTLERVCAIIESQARSFGFFASRTPSGLSGAGDPAAGTELAGQIRASSWSARTRSWRRAQADPGSEDFAWMLQRCTSACLFIGNGVSRPMVHNPAYDFNDNILLTSTSY